MSGSTNVLNMATSLDVSPAFSPFTGVRLWYDDENVIFSGDETGRVLEADCPWATQEIADSVLAAIQGYVYQPFMAQTAILDPVAELGDGVNVGGVYGPLAVINADFGAMFSAEIGAPQDEEIDHEYPYLSGPERKFNRQIAQTRSLITKTADSIRLEVKALDESLDSYATLEVTDKKIESAVSGKIDEERANSLIKQAMDSIELSVSSSDGNTTLKLTGGGVELSSNTVEISVDALNISGQINADQLNLTGAITFGDLDSDTQSQINNRGISASRARTIINEELVSSPNIAGGKFWDLEQENWIEMGEALNGTVAYFNHYFSGYSSSSPVFVMGYYAPNGVDNWVMAPFNDIVLDYVNGTMYVVGDWDFSQADVSGLEGTGGGDVTVTPVWG